MRKPYGFFMSFFMLACFIVVGALIVNDWDVDKIRPDVQRNSGMVVFPETVDNEEFNTLVEDGYDDDGNYNEGYDDSLAELNNKSLGSCPSTRVSGDVYEEYLKEMVCPAVEQFVKSNGSGVYGAVYYFAHYKKKDGTMDGLAYPMETPFLAEYGSATGTKCLYGSEIQRMIYSFATEQYSKDSNNALFTSSKFKQSMKSKVASDKKLSDFLSDEGDASNPVYKGIDSSIASVWRYYNLKTSTNKVYSTFIDAISGEVPVYCSNLHLNVYESPKTTITMNNHDLDGRYEPCIEVKEVKKLFEGQMVSTKRKSPTSSKGSTYGTNFSLCSYAKLRYDSFSTLIIVLGSVDSTKSLSSYSGWETAYQTLKTMYGDTAIDKFDAYMPEGDDADTELYMIQSGETPAK